MKMIIVLGMAVLLPQLALAGTDCQVVDLGDHFEAVCQGDAPKAPVAAPAAARTQQTAAARELSEGVAPPPAQERTFEELQAAQELREADGDLKSSLSTLGALHGEMWLRTLPHS